MAPRRYDLVGTELVLSDTGPYLLEEHIVDAFLQLQRDTVHRFVYLQERINLLEQTNADLVVAIRTIRASLESGITQDELLSVIDASLLDHAEAERSKKEFDSEHAEWRNSVKGRL